MTSLTKLLAGTSLALVAVAPTWVAAQTTTGPDTSAKSAVAPAATKVEKPSDDVIVVTAERKEQNIQKYAGTAFVLSGKSLKEVGVQNITDLEGRIPGLQILPNNNNTEVYIRGVGSSNNTELGDPASGLYLDGIYLPRPSGIGTNFFDLDRVEVAIGPQGTLRGRNATAGTVNFIPWHPGLGVYDAYIEGGIGNYGQKTLEGMVNIPIGKKLAIRLSGNHTEHDTYTRNLGPVRGLRGPEYENNFSGRAQLFYKPTEKFDILLSFDNTKEIGGGTIGTNLAGAEGAGVNPTSVSNTREVYLFPTDPHLSSLHNGERAEVNYHGSDLNIQFTASHRHLLSDFIGSPPGLLAYPGGLANANALDSTGNVATDFSHYETQTLSNSSTQELRITAPKGSRFEWTLGAFHFTESQASFLGSVADQNAYFQGIEFNTRTKSDSLAAYTDETLHVNDKLRLTAGIRYTDERKERTGVAARYLLALGGGDFNCCLGPIVGTPGFQFAGLGRTNYTLPDPTQSTPFQQQQALDFYLGGIRRFGVNDTVPTIFPGGRIPTTPTGPCVPNPQTPFLFCAANGNYTYATIDNTEFFAQNASARYNFIDWRVRAEYDVAPGHLVYGLIATGNKAGGFNDNFGTGGIAPTYRPERVTNFEFGSKNKFTIGGLPAKFNITGFYEDYHDQVLSSLLSISAAARFASQQSGTPITFPANFTPGAIIVNYNYNAANSAIAGSQVEASLTIPQARLNLTFNGLWLPVAKVTSSQVIEDFRFQSDINSVDAGFRSIQNKRLPRTPRIQLNLQIQQKFETKIGKFSYVVAPGYRSSTNATIFNGQDYGFDATRAGIKLPDANGVLQTQNVAAYRSRLNDTISGYWTLDLGAGYSTNNGKLRLEAYANNVVYKNNVAGILISQTGGTVAFYQRPTTYGARLHVRF